MSFLFQRGLILAKLETVFDTDAAPTAALDAFLVMEPSFEPDITFLERANVRPSLSKDAPIAGRKLGKLSFKHEVRNNGNLNASVEPKLGRLLRACGLQMTQANLAAETLDSVVGTTGNSGGDTTTWTVTTAYAQPSRRRITVVATSGGATARLSVTAPAEGDLPAIDTGTADIIAADNVEFDVYDVEGNFVVGLTPNFSGTVVTGDQWIFELRPTGYYYAPRSSQFESLTLYLYLPDDTGQSLLHRITGARGTVSVEATGGQFATFSFTFTGSYQSVQDVAYPADPVYETQKPHQVELANLKVVKDGDEVSTLCAAMFTIDLGNTVQPRDCLNSANAYAGALIVDRKPVMGMDPETVLEATHPFWANMEQAVGVEFSARVGVNKGNTVLFYAGNVTTSGLSYKDRNSIRAYDFKGDLSAVSPTGDDELIIGFV